MNLQRAASVLGVGIAASAEQVKRAFRLRAQETHPDVTKDDSAAFLLVVEAKEVFDKHFELAAAADAKQEEDDDIAAELRKRAASQERVRPVVARPYRPGEVDWARAVPRWPEVKNSAVFGIRSDGQVDLLVNNTYITTLNSLLGLVEHLKRLITAQPDATPTVWERYIVYIAQQSSGELTTMGLRNLWERVMLEEGAEAHAPDLQRTRRMKPDDFS
jgi:hypothetical protein